MRGLLKTAVLAGTACPLRTLAALGRDDGQWSAQPPEIRAWFQSVMQPGWEGVSNQGRSCCGEGDAFDVTPDGNGPDNSIRVRIIDGKGVIPDGTDVDVPREKIQTRYGNPLDRYILFLVGAGESNQPLCLIPKVGA